MISDGIFEAKSPDREEFGTERVVAVLREHHARKPAEILDRLRHAVGEFTHGQPQDDDETAILIQRHV